MNVLRMLLVASALTRPTTALLAGVVGVASAMGIQALTPTQLLLIFVVVSTATGGGFVVNDIADRELDRVDHPERPLPSGRTSPQLAALLASGLFLLSLLAAAAGLGLAAFTLVAANVGTLLAYSAVSRWSKVVANLVTAYLASSVFCLGFLAAAQTTELPMTLLSVVFVGIVAREIVLDIHDQSGDRSVGRRSLPVLFGTQLAFTVTWLLILTASGILATKADPRSAEPSLAKALLWASLVLLSAGILTYQVRPLASTYRLFVAMTRVSLALGGTSFAFLSLTAAVSDSLAVVLGILCTVLGIIGIVFAPRSERLLLSAAHTRGRDGA